MRARKLLFAGVALGVIAGAPLAPAMAQDAQNASDTTEGPVILVTARKREESLQEVPISITALTDEALQDANVYGVEDIAELTPGLQFRQIGGFNEVTIRGLAQTDQGGLQGNVGVFIDGIFMNNRTSIEFANMELARVEVLKGPQSSLFGRNTFAGAINYVTKPARLGEIEGVAEVQAGGDERAGVKGSINLPLGDNFAIRAFGGYNKYDGAIDNLRGNDNVGGWDKRATYGATALFETGPIKLTAFYTRNEIADDNPAFSLIPASANNAGALYQVTNTSGVTTSYWTINSGPFPQTETVSLDSRASGNKGHFWLAYGNLDFDLGFATLTGNISTSKSKYAARIDSIGNPAFYSVALIPGQPYSGYLLVNLTGDLGKQDSYEVRLASNPGSSIDWLVGYSHYESTTGKILSSNVPLLANVNQIATITFVEDRLISKSDAFFGSFNYALSDAFNIGGELRYTQEDQAWTNSAIIVFAPQFNRPLSTKTIDFNYWTGKISADYLINDDTMIYGYAARGVKSGGLNFSRPTTDPFYSYGPEFNWSYELGVKSTMFGGRAVVNLAGFYIDWTDIQTTAPAEIASGATATTFNGVGAVSKGVEIDASIDLTDNFNVRLAGSYADATYNEGFIDGAVQARCGRGSPRPAVQSCAADVGGNQLANAADVNLFAAAKYTVPDVLWGLDAFARISYSYEAGKFLESTNIANTGSTELVNLRLGFTNDDTEIAFWVDNLLDSFYFARITPVTDTTANAVCGCTGISSTQVIRGNGRSWGVTLRREF